MYQEHISRARECLAKPLFFTLAFFFIIFGVSLFSTGHSILYHYIYSIVFGLTHHDGRHRDARLDGNMLHLRPVCQAIGSVIFNEEEPKQNEKDEREKKKPDEGKRLNLLIPMDRGRAFYQGKCFWKRGESSGRIMKHKAWCQYGFDYC